MRSRPVRYSPQYPLTGNCNCLQRNCSSAVYRKYYWFLSFDIGQNLAVTWWLSLN